MKLITCHATNYYLEQNRTEQNRTEQSGTEVVDAHAVWMWKIDKMFWKWC